MTESELSWTRDKINFYGKLWKPDRDPRAVVLLLHGFNDHINRFGQVAAMLCEQGLAVLGFDLRGHGRSTGKRGHIPDYEAYMADIDEAMKKIKAEVPDKPILLYGHSMGGNLAANYIIRRNPLIAGAILSAPWFRLAFKPPGLKVFFGRIINNIFPGFTQKADINTKHLTRDRDVVTAYENDPMLHGKISARLGLEIMDAGEYAIENASKITVPILLMHGGSDMIISVEASREFAKNASHSDLQLNIFKGFFHEIHNEPEKDQVFRTIRAWLSVRLG